MRNCLRCITVATVEMERLGFCRPDAARPRGDGLIGRPAPGLRGAPARLSVWRSSPFALVLAVREAGLDVETSAAQRVARASWRCAGEAASGRGSPAQIGQA